MRGPATGPVAKPARLRTALIPIRHQTALLDGSVKVPGVELDVVDVRPHPEIFRRMGRDDEFDLCELSVMTYLVGRDLGRPWSAIPVVPRSRFHHRDFLVNVDAAVESPEDLAGLRVGTRNWTVTPGVHDRGILCDEFGVTADSIRWVLAEGEHVAESELRYPPYVEPGTCGDLFDQLVSGALPAGIAGANARSRPSDRLRPLFPDFAERDAAQYARTGIVPPFTVVVVHDRVLEGRPWLLEALYEGFAKSRDGGLEPGPGVAEIAPDSPVPIGLEANRAGLEELVRLGHEQGILSTRTAVDDLFAPFE